MERSKVLNKELLSDPPHNDPVLFKAAIEYSSRISGFGLLQLEKDYFCSLILACLFSEDTNLVVNYQHP